MTDLATRESRLLGCDTVVFTGDWIPDHELARVGELAIDPGTRGPRVDPAYRTSREGVFAVGNLLHGAETADVAALEGRAVASSVRSWLAGDRWPTEYLALTALSPLAWVVPNALPLWSDARAAPGLARSAHPVQGQFVLRVRRFVDSPWLEIRQNDRVLWQGHPGTGMLATFLPGRLSRVVPGPLVPGRPVHVPSGWESSVCADDGPVVIRVRGAGEAVAASDAG